MPSQTQSEHANYRIILIARNGASVLLTRGADGGLRLPHVTVARSGRAVENVRLAMKTEWGQEVICLFQLDPEAPNDLDRIIRYEVVEPCRAVGNAAPITQWISVDHLSEDCFAELSDRSAIHKSLAQCTALRSGTSTSGIGRLGWFRELCGWVARETASRGLHLNGNFRQLNATPSFSLIRFETDGPAVWFKAVGTPKKREFPITLLLARMFPGRLAQVLATQPAWNGWLMAECDGTELCDSTDVGPWTVAAQELATMQVESIARTAQLLAAGAHDLTTGKLLTAIDPLMSLLESLMERQVKVPPSVLTHNDLHLLAERIGIALRRVEDCGIPPALGHLDPNPGNIVVDSDRCGFLDWAEAYIGNPFYTFEYLLEHFRRAGPTSRTLEQQLTESYANPWRRTISPGAVAELLAFAPLLAVFVYAVALTKDRPRQQDPGAAAYLRSLARRMDCEAKQIFKPRFQCQK